MNQSLIICIILSVTFHPLYSIDTDIQSVLEKTIDFNEQPTGALIDSNHSFKLKAINSEGDEPSYQLMVCPLSTRDQTDCISAFENSDGSPYTLKGLPLDNPELKKMIKEGDREGFYTVAGVTASTILGMVAVTLGSKALGVIAAKLVAKGKGGPLAQKLAQLATKTTNKPFVPKGKPFPYSKTLIAHIKNFCTSGNNLLRSQLQSINQRLLGSKVGQAVHAGGSLLTKNAVLTFLVEILREHVEENEALYDPTFGAGKRSLAKLERLYNLSSSGKSIPDIRIKDLNTTSHLLAKVINTATDKKAISKVCTLKKKKDAFEKVCEEPKEIKYF